MKKETIVAIFLGVLLGVGGAGFLISKARQIGSQGTVSPQIRNNNPKTTNTSTKEVGLEITVPADRVNSATDTVIIKGKAAKGTLVVIQSPIKAVAINNEKGSFTAEFPLALGENVISITAYAKEVQVPPQQKTLKVYFLDEE